MTKKIKTIKKKMRMIKTILKLSITINKIRPIKMKMKGYSQNR